jgi:branched-chain amino acid transport system ATP-binding protein
MRSSAPGAGKSTLINMLSGEIPPSAGTVHLLGQDVTEWTQPRRARAGLGRSYQRNTIFPGFTVLENCRLAAQASHQRPWAWWQSAARCELSLVPRGRRCPARGWMPCSIGPPAC